MTNIVNSLMSRGPDFLIAGAARCSTSALARYLSAQDGVAFTTPKESHFLAHAGRAVDYRGPGDDRMMNEMVMATPEAWSDLFVGHPDDVVVGEGSVSTMAFPDESLPAIDRWCPPDVKVIICLRDPVERMYSSWLYLRSRGHERIEDFEAALAAEPERTADGWHHMWRYRALSDYAPQVDAFVGALGADRVHLVVAERLSGLDSPEFAGVMEFLGVPISDRGTEFGAINAGGVPKTTVAARAVMAVQKSSALVAVARRAVPLGVRERLHSRLFEREGLSDALWSKLHPEFEPTIESIESRLGPIPEWRTRGLSHA